MHIAWVELWTKISCRRILKTDKITEKFCRVYFALLLSCCGAIDGIKVVQRYKPHIQKTKKAISGRRLASSEGVEILY